MTYPETHTVSVTDGGNSPTPETIASLTERLDRLEAHRSKWEDEGKALEQSIDEARQRISRAIKLLEESLGLHRIKAGE